MLLYNINTKTANKTLWRALNNKKERRGEAGMAAKFQLELLNGVKETRKERGWSQTELAQMVGVSRNTISSIETGAFNPTAKLALILCIALDKKFEELFWFAE